LLQQHLRRGGEKQISTSDPDSRQLITRNNITEVAYNVQTTVDAQHKLVVDYLVTNTNDSKTMGAMLERAVGELGTRNERGRLIERCEHTGLIEANKGRIHADPATCKLRQQLVAHPYGTIKRQWGFDYVMNKCYLERASADVGLIFTVYNLRRLMTIFSPGLLKVFFKALQGLSGAGFPAPNGLLLMRKQKKVVLSLQIDFSHGRLQAG